MSKRKRSAANDAPAEGGGEEDEEVQAQLDEEEDSEMQRRLAERRSAENDRMMCAAHTFVFAREPLSLCECFLTDGRYVPLLRAVSYTRASSASPPRSSSSASNSGSAPPSPEPPCAD